jgi:hypothetical protein
LYLIWWQASLLRPLRNAIPFQFQKKSRANWFIWPVPPFIGYWFVKSTKIFKRPLYKSGWSRGADVVHIFDRLWDHGRVLITPNSKKNQLLETVLNKNFWGVCETVAKKTLLASIT